LKYREKSLFEKDIHSQQNNFGINMYFFNKNIVSAVLWTAMLCWGSAVLKTSSERISSNKHSAITEQINYGTDICAFTGDLIETVRYGGRIVMKDGTDLQFHVCGMYSRILSGTG
jgi:hypothetical protein